MAEPNQAMLSQHQREATTLEQNPYPRGYGGVEGEGPWGRGCLVTHPCQEGVLQEPGCIGPLLRHPAMLQ